MNKYIAALEAITDHERITPTEIKDRLKKIGIHATIEELVRNKVIIPDNSQAIDGERFYIVNIGKVIDFNKKLPLSDSSYFGMGYSYKVSTRIENIVYKWAKEMGLVDAIRKIWNFEAAPEYLGDIYKLAGRSEEDIRKYLTSRLIYLKNKNLPLYKPSYSHAYVLIATLKAYLGYKRTPENNKLIGFLKRKIAKCLFEVPSAIRFIKEIVQ